MMIFSICSSLRKWLLKTLKEKSTRWNRLLLIDLEYREVLIFLNLLLLLMFLRILLEMKPWLLHIELLSKSNKRRYKISEECLVEFRQKKTISKLWIKWLLAVIISCWEHLKSINNLLNLKNLRLISRVIELSMMIWFNIEEVQLSLLFKGKLNSLNQFFSQVKNLKSMLVSSKKIISEIWSASWTNTKLKIRTWQNEAECWKARSIAAKMNSMWRIISSKGLKVISRVNYQELEIN